LIKKLTTSCTFLPNLKLYSQTGKKLCYQTREGLWNFSKTSSFQHYPYSVPFFQHYSKCPFYFPSLYHLPRLITFIFPMKVVGTSILKISNWKSCSEERPKLIRIRPFQEKEMEGGEKKSQFGGQWRFHCLVANGLVANGRRRSNTFLPLPTFPPTNFT
jgi:hypothetical protein